MSTQRWKLVDTETGDSWVMPMNPRTMTAPPNVRTIRTGYGVASGVNRLRSFETPAVAQPWEWTGYIRSQDHHDTLRKWALKSGVIEVHDHLGRVFEVAITDFVPTDRRPTVRTPWRLTYTMKTLLLRRTA